MPVLYDGAGRLIAIPGVISDIRYNARGQSQLVSYANGVTSTFAYNSARGWLTGLTHANSAGPLMTLNYTRATTGRIQSVANPANGTESWTYSYDDLDRLLGASNAGNASYNQTFAYDIANNITYNSAVGTYTYPLAGSAHPHAPLTAGSKAFAYNANGDITSDGSRTFAYDGENRPANVSGTLYTYGPDGERISKTTSTGVTTLYLGGDVEFSGGVWTKYLNPDAKRVGPTPGSSVTSWMHADHLASIRLITGSAGQQLERANYRPYGQQFPGLSQSKGWINQKFDPETGLQYLHARYYDPVIGLFLTPDTLDPTEAGVGTNRYAYSDGDPINKSDPNGHSRHHHNRSGGSSNGNSRNSSNGRINDGNSNTSIKNQSSNALARQSVGGISQPLWESEGGGGELGLSGGNLFGQDNIFIGGAGGSGGGGAGLRVAPTTNSGVVGTRSVTPKATRGGESPAAKAGRAAHKDLANQVSKKPGWQSEPRLVGADGKVCKPDAVSPFGYIIELKPNTPTGLAAGARQIERYLKQLGMPGRIITY